MNLAEAIESHRETIVEDWLEHARSLATRYLSEPALVDGIPRLLDALVAWLRRAESDEVAELEAQSEHHALDRLRQGYALPQIVAEYSALRTVMVRVVGPALSRDPVRAIERLNRAIDLAIGDAVEKFTQERRRADAESEARLQAVIDNAPAIIYVKEYRRTGGTMLMASRHFAERFGLEPSAMLGKTDLDLHPDIAPDVIARWRANDLIVMEDDRTLRIEENIPEGDLMHTWLTLKFPLRDTGGVPYAVCAIATDVTREKAIAVARERFIGILGHDLRNPLAAIAVAANVIADSEVPDNARRLATRIERNAESMGEMISSLLDFTRARMGAGIPVTPAPNDLGEIARRVADEFVAGTDRPIEVTVEGDVRGTWDGDRLRQAFGNLISNALGHGVGPIAIRALDRGPWVALQVHNQGLAIPADARDSLFEPFQKSTTSKGLGLGLYIVREIARAHGGTVAVDSGATGVTIEVVLPRVASPSSSVA